MRKSRLNAGRCCTSIEVNWIDQSLAFMTLCSAFVPHVLHELRNAAQSRWLNV